MRRYHDSSCFPWSEHSRCFFSPFLFFYYVFPFSSHNRQSIRNESLNAFHTISSKILFKEASCSKKKFTVSFLEYVVEPMTVNRDWYSVISNNYTLINYEVQRRTVSNWLSPVSVRQLRRGRSKGYREKVKL